MATLNAEQKKLGYSTAIGPYNPITGELNSPNIPVGAVAPTTPLQIATDTTTEPNYGSMIGSITQGLIDDYTTYNNQLTKAQTQQTGTGNNILSLMEQMAGKTADTQLAEDATGVNRETENLNNFVSQLAELNGQAKSLNREAQAIPLVVQERNRNTGATDRGIAPQTTGMLRENAIRALSIAQQSDIAVAGMTGSQLRLQAAKDKAQQMIDLKYKPLEARLAMKEKQYELNKDSLDAIDKKRSEALSVAIKNEADELADKKERAKQVETMLLDAQANQAPEGILASARDIAKKGGSAVDVARAIGKYSSATARALLLKEQLSTERLQQANIRSTMADRAARLRIAQAEAAIKENKTVTDADKRLVLEDKLALIKGIKTHKGLSAAVGSSGPLGRGGRLDAGAARQSFIGDVEQLVSKETLDTLLNLKAQGGTLGALSDEENRMLRSAANKIGTWTIKNGDGRVTGYRVGEKAFKAELDNITKITERAYEKAGGTASTSYLDTVESALTSEIGPMDTESYLNSL